MRINDFLLYFEEVSGRDGQYYALCPAHDDHKKSLSISQNLDGQILVNCHAGCSSKEIVQSIGLSMDDLSPIYNYCDEEGNLLAQKIRKTGKKFIWRQPDGHDGWIYNRSNVPRVLYNLPAAKDAKRIYVVEGEKDVDTLCSFGIVAVCGADGAGTGKWYREYSEQLAGKEIVILSDNDKVGMAFAHETADSLFGIAKAIRLVDLSDVWADIPTHGDVTDLIKHMGKPGLRSVRKLANSTENYKPSVEKKSGATCDHALVSLDAVERTPPQYFWEPYIRLNNVNIIRGDGGTGKTMFLLALAAAVTTGITPDGMPGTLHQKQAAVIYYGAEDDPGEYSFRANLCGCNGELIYVINDGETPPALSSLETIRAHVIEKQAKLLILDPLQSFLGSNVNMNHANEIRPLLDGIRTICRELDFTVVIVEHLNKATQQKAHYRGIGSVDIINASRSTIMIGWHPDIDNMRVALHIKANAKYGRTIMFRIEDDGRFVWQGTCDITEENMVGSSRIKGQVDAVTNPVLAVVLGVMEKHPDGWSGSATKMLEDSGVQLSIDEDAEFCRSIGKSLPGLQKQLHKRGIFWHRNGRTHFLSRKDAV